jgi:PIN domain nuclease of toxin-antitoxin system
MNLLLDTQALLWWLGGNPRLGRRAHAVIADPGSAVWISAATAWEIAIKVGLGRLDLGEPPETCLPRELQRSGFRPLPVTVPHALAVHTLPHIHADPFDRMLIVQAVLEGLTLVSSDAVMAQYDVSRIDARV